MILANEKLVHRRANVLQPRWQRPNGGGIAATDLPCIGAKERAELARTLRVLLGHAVVKRFARIAIAGRYAARWRTILVRRFIAARTARTRWGNSQHDMSRVRTLSVCCRERCLGNGKNFFV